MANASKKHIGVGTQGKGDGTGGLTTMPDGLATENMILSNRDKKQHSEERGQDGKAIQTEQHQDHAGNRYPEEQGHQEAEGGSP